MLYLDYAASTPLGQNALATLKKSFEMDFANPSSSHKLGRALEKELLFIRKEFLSLLGAPKTAPNQKMIFTSSASESNNMIIMGLKLSEGHEVIYTKADHPSVVAPVLKLEDKEVILREYLLNNEGEIVLEDLKKKIIKGQTKLIIISGVNNQSGNINNIKLISKEIRKICNKLHIHIDASQSFMKHKFSLNDADVDSLSISAHKVLGPKGVSGLYIKDSAKIDPLIYGGGQEFNLRPSTVSAPLIKSFYASVFQDAKKEYCDDTYERISLLNQFLRSELKKIDSSIIFPFPINLTSSYILTFILPKISSDIILRHLEEKGIYLSSSSACSSKIKGFNPVFNALNIEEKYHKNILRLSFGADHNKEDMEYFISEFKIIYNELKQFFR